MATKINTFTERSKIWQTTKSIDRLTILGFVNHCLIQTLSSRRKFQHVQNNLVPRNPRIKNILEEKLSKASDYDFTILITDANHLLNSNSCWWWIYEIIDICEQRWKERNRMGPSSCTVKPLLSAGPLLSGHLSNSRKSLPILTVNVTSIKRTRSPFRLPNWQILLYFTSIKRLPSQIRTRFFDTTISQQCYCLGKF